MTTDTRVEHTPGPWLLDDRIPGAERIVAKSGYGIGSVFTAGAPSFPERLANAHLIASAPELLAALQALVRADNTNYERDTMRYVGLFDAARDALEAATGQRY